MGGGGGDTCKCLIVIIIITLVTNKGQVTSHLNLPIIFFISLNSIFIKMGTRMSYFSLWDVKIFTYFKILFLDNNSEKIY